MENLIENFNMLLSIQLLTIQITPNVISVSNVKVSFKEGLTKGKVTYFPCESSE